MTQSAIDKDQWSCGRLVLYSLSLKCNVKSTIGGIKKLNLSQSLLKLFMEWHAVMKAGKISALTFWQ